MTLIDQLNQQSSRNAVSSIIRRLLLGAAVYHIWRERNLRLRKKVTLPAKDISRDIVEEVRLKLCSLKTRNSSQVKKAADVWSITTGP